MVVSIDTASSPYTGLKVIELAEDPAGEMTGKFLADLGATVTKIELPEGSPTRRVGPFAGSRDVNRSLTFWYYNTGKRSKVIDYRNSAGMDEVRNLLAEADVLVCSLSAAELREQSLDLNELAEHHTSLIVVSVTPFGLDGPWRDWMSSDLVAMALGGILNSCGYDDHSIPPIRPGENHSYHSAAAFAHIGVLLALLDRMSTGLGQVVDVAMHDCLAVGVEMANPYWFYPRSLTYRQTCRHAQPVPTQPALFRCGDGRYVYFAFISAEIKPWQSLVSWLRSHDIAADLGDPAYDDPQFRQANFDHVQDVIEAFFLSRPAEQIYREGQQMQLPIGVLNAPDEVLSDAHLRARGYFAAVDAGDGTTVDFPGLPYSFSAWANPPLTRAPRLGEHGDAT